MNHNCKNTIKIGVILDHRQCLEILADNSLEAPKIPVGCNTVRKSFALADGRHAVIVNQKGFSPNASDNEEQINGLSLFIAIEPPTPSIERQLHDWVEAELHPVS